MAMTGFICQDEYLAKCAKLSDQEVGRLFRALMQYHATGIEPELAGRESIAFDFIRDDIDKAEKAYAAKCEKNRQNRLITNDNERGRTITNVDERAQNINIKDKEKEEDKQNAHAREGWLTDEDIHEALQRDEQIEQAAKGAGLNVSETVMVKARDYAKEYGMDKLIDAINKTALAAQKPSWKYVEGVLKNGARENEHRGDHRRDDGERKPSGKYSQFFADVS